MKKSTFILVCLCLAALSSFAQNEDRIVRLSENHYCDTITSRPDNDDDMFLNIIITKNETYLNGDTKVTLELENFSDSRHVHLFGRAYDKTELKKDYRIIFDKNFRNQNRVEKYEIGEGGHPQDIEIEPEEAKTITLRIKEGDERICTLPIYFSKKFKCKRRKILVYETKILRISVEEPIDENYNKLNQKCDSLIDAIDDVVFCKHKSHRPPLEKQKEPYVNAIHKIQSEINTILDKNHWPKTNKNYKLYHELITKLDGITFYEVDDCGNKALHNKPHNCKYCSKSFKEICTILQNYYQKKDLGESLTANDKAEIKMMYDCCKLGGHAKKWNAGGDGYKKQIENYYKAIMNP